MPTLPDGSGRLRFALYMHYRGLPPDAGGTLSSDRTKVEAGLPRLHATATLFLILCLPGAFGRSIQASSMPSDTQPVARPSTGPDKPVLKLAKETLRNANQIRQASSVTDSNKLQHQREFRPETSPAPKRNAPVKKKNQEGCFADLS